MSRILLTISAVLLFSLNTYSQHTSEEKLQKDSSSILSHVSIGGYGNARYMNDFNTETATMNLDRFVLFVGYKFSNKISLFTEVEVEDAKVDAEGGEVALEQCYLKFNLDPQHYFTAGLFIPRIGIINENHLPNTYNGNERPMVETFIIPTTWRELGVGFYGTTGRFPLSYSVAVLNGLNSAHFEHGTLIRGGRSEGRDATANNLALTGSAQFYKNNFKIQLSGYYGGSVGLASLKADSLKLTSGVFGTPVMIGDVNLQYEWKGFAFRALGCVVSIPDASDINRAYASNTPESAYGAYAEIAYNLLHNSKAKNKKLNLFARYEMLDMNAEIPENGITDGTLKQQHIVTGLTYLPVKNVVLKADVRFMTTENENPALIINPSPIAVPYETNNTFLNLGLGFSF